METFPAFLMISTAEDAKLLRRVLQSTNPGRMPVRLPVSRIAGYVAQLEELIHESETQQSASRT